MKRKLTIVLCVCLLAVLLCTTFVSCKKKPSAPTYDEIYSLLFMNEYSRESDGYKYSSYALSKLNDLATSGEYMVEYKNKGIFFCKNATGVNVYSLVAGDFIVTGLSENAAFESLSSELSGVYFIIDRDNGVIYDYYGTKLVELGSLDNVEKITTKNFELYPDANDLFNSVRYAKYVLKVNVGLTVEEKSFTVEIQNGIVKEANSVKDPYPTEEKADLKPGDSLERNERFDLSELMGSKYKDYYLEDFSINGYNVFRITDKDGKPVSEARLPEEYEVCLVVGSKVLFVAKYTLPITATKYSYFDESNGVYKLLDYKSFDILTGAVETVNFNYVINDFDFIIKPSVVDGNLNLEYISALVKVREIKNGLLASNTQVLEIGDNFTVKSDRTDTLGLCDSDKILKLADDKYLINYNDKDRCAIVDGFFKNPIYLNATTTKVDYQSRSIIVKSDGLFGVLDFEGKIKIVPSFSSVDNICGGKATVKYPDSNRQFIIDLVVAEEPAKIFELGNFKNDRGDVYLVRNETVDGMVEERELMTAHDEATDTDYTYVHVKITNRDNTATILEYNTSNDLLYSPTAVYSFDAADKTYYVFYYLNREYKNGSFEATTRGFLYTVVERTGTSFVRSTN